MKPRPTTPYIGDIHLLKDYPEGTPLAQVTEFEIWDGKEWIHAAEAEGKVYPIFGRTGLLGKDSL